LPKKTIAFGEVTENNCHYAVQRHSMSPSLLTVFESDFLLVNKTNLLSHIVSKLLCSIAQISPFDSGTFF